MSHPVGPAVARAEFDRLEAAIVDPATLGDADEAGPAIESVEPPD